jgi:quercetin dioxygenase-like cupin family protein
MREATFIPELDVDVPPDGTLSKVVYKDDMVRVVAFAFDAGQELTEHTASVPAVVQVLSGSLRLTLGSETVEARTGSWTHMPAGLPHAIVALEPSTMLLTLIRC